MYLRRVFRAQAPGKQVVSHHVSPELYGIFGIILGLTTSINLMLLAGIPLTVSKYVAENTAFTSSIQKQASALQGAFSAIIFVLYLRRLGLLRYIPRVAFHALNNRWLVATMRLLPERFWAAMIKAFRRVRY